MNVIFTAFVVVFLRLRDFEDEFADLTTPKAHRDVAIMMPFLMFYSNNM